MDVPQPLLGKLRAGDDRYRSGVFGAHAPLGDVHVVRPPASDHAEAVGVVAQHGAVGRAVEPQRVHAFFRVVNQGRGAEPPVVVQVRRHRHFRFHIPGGIHRQPDQDLLNLANAAIANQLAGIAKAIFRSLLASLLENAARPLHGIRHLAAFLDGQRSGLLEIDVFTGQRRFHSGLRVPVIGRADAHRIDALVLEHFAIIGVGSELRVLPCSELLRVGMFEQILRVGKADRVQVAHGHVPGHIAISKDAPEFGVPGDAAAADLRHLDHVIRCAPAENAGRDNGGKSNGRGCA